MTVSGNVHFVLPGWSNAFCNEPFPGDTQWSGQFDDENDWADPRFTMHTDKTSCPDCIRAITAANGEIESTHVTAPPVELDHYDRAVAWLKSVGNNVNDELAINAAGVYATLAVADSLNRVNTGLEGLREYLAGVAEARGDEEHV